MCSVQDTDIPVKKESSTSRINRLCMKCQEQKAILITRVNDAFCADCFQVYITHKFRATIGKTKLVRDGELVLVAFSGGPSSSALLQLIQEGLSIRAHKKLRFKPGLIFIDEGAATGQSVEERLDTCERVSDIMNRTGFPYYIKSLEEGLSTEYLSRSPEDLHLTPPTTDTVSPTIDCDTESLYSSGTASVTLPTMSTCSSPTIRDMNNRSPDYSRRDGFQSRFQIYEAAENQLVQSLKACKTISAKEDFIRLLRHTIIHEVAKSCGYSKVMLGNCGTLLAVRLLTDISTGRGSQAAMETSFADKRHSDIMFLRPLRDFSSKEIAMYNNLHKVEPVFIPTITTKGAVDVSIEHLTEHFVTGLQADYPSTVSNIMRTGEKLDGSVEKVEDRMCAMCQGPLDTNVGASSAMSAVLFSQQISRAKKQDSMSCIPDRTIGHKCRCIISNVCCVIFTTNLTSQETRLHVLYAEQYIIGMLWARRRVMSYQDKYTDRAEPRKWFITLRLGRNSLLDWRPSVEEVLANLCYGCSLIIKDMRDVCYLPEYVLKDVSWRARRMKMKENIQEFLLQET